MSQGAFYRVGGADPAQTTEWEVVVEDEHLLRVVETLDILTRLGIVSTSVHMLHHVKVGRDVGEVFWLVNVQHLIHEVDIPEIPACSGLILYSQRRFNSLFHQVCPVIMFHWHDHLVYVKKCDVLVPVHVPVQAVVVGDELILPLIVQLALEVHVLQHRQVRLVPGQGDGGHVHHAFACVVVKNLCDIRMNLQIIEEYLISSQSVQELYPLSKPDTEIILRKIETLD